MQILGADMVVGHPLYYMGWKAAPRPLITYLYFLGPKEVPRDRTTSSFDVVYYVQDAILHELFCLKDLSPIMGLSTVLNASKDVVKDPYIVWISGRIVSPLYLTWPGLKSRGGYMTIGKHNYYCNTW